MEYQDWLEQEAKELRREEREVRVERFLPPRILTKSHRLIKQVVKNWNPPRLGDPESLETCVGTGFMGGLAIAMGEEFPWHELNDTQQAVVRQFIQSTDAFLEEPRTD